ncbi:hypothetical protein DBR06_SOUSAS6110015, partial [Sousa chinensis]
MALANTLTLALANTLTLALTNTMKLVLTMALILSITKALNMSLKGDSRAGRSACKRELLSCKRRKNDLKMG